MMKGRCAGARLRGELELELELFHSTKLKARVSHIDATAYTPLHIA
jgi:hypothetical protein